ncbi:MAG: hypothetical protein QXW41_07405 [Fervidicoccaceae archaeon]
MGEEVLEEGKVVKDVRKVTPTKDGQCAVFRIPIRIWRDMGSPENVVVEYHRDAKQLVLKPFKL